MKIFIAVLLTETNTLVPIPTGQEDFTLSKPGDESNSIGSTFAASRKLVESRGHQFARSIGAAAMPAGLTVRKAYENFRDRILSDLEAAMPVDAVCLKLHGAMVAEGYCDCEGDLLTRVRNIVGSNTVIGVNLDPHSHLSETIVKNADIIVLYKEWPHVDEAESMQETILLTIDVAEGKYTPHMSVFDCKMIESMNTFSEPMKSIVSQIRDMEGKDGIISISIVHGFSYADILDMGSKVLVITDNQPEKGTALAKEIGQKLFDLRGKLGPTYLNLSQGLDAMEKADKFPLIVADAADMPGGGAPGDATFLLRGMIERGITDVAAVYQWDPMAVNIAIKAGEGAILPLRIGGKSGPTAGEPLDVEVKVIRIFENLIVGDGVQAQEVGPVAVVRTHGIDIALETNRSVAWDWIHFKACGMDPENRKYLIVKSANNHYAGYLEIAGSYIYISAPGACTAQIENLEFKHIQRPMWPFDKDPFAKRKFNVK